MDRRPRSARTRRRARADVPLVLILPDGIRLSVRGAERVPRESDRASVVGSYYRVSQVVWKYGEEIKDGDRTVPAMPTEIHLEPALAIRGAD